MFIIRNSHYFLSFLSVLSIYIREARANSFVHCEGWNDDKAMRLVDSSFPDVFYVPGESLSSLSIDVLRDIEHEDLVMDVEMLKGESEWRVPCMGGGGSCKVDLCEAITSDEEICKHTTISNGDGKCGCPVKKGRYSLKDKKGIIEDKGAMNSFMVGNYKGTIKIYSKAAPNDILLCLEYKFEMKKADKKPKSEEL